MKNVYDFGLRDYCWENGCHISMMTAVSQQSDCHISLMTAVSQQNG